MRERNGKTLSFVSPSEDAAVPTINERVANGSTIYADEATHWDELHARYRDKADQSFAGLFRWRRLH